jgi:hypothetical protein
MAWLLGAAIIAAHLALSSLLLNDPPTEPGRAAPELAERH